MTSDYCPARRSNCSHALWTMPRGITLASKKLDAECIIGNHTGTKVHPCCTTGATCTGVMAPDVASETKPDRSSNGADIRELTELVSKLASLPASVEPKSWCDNFRVTPNGSCHTQNCTSGGGSNGSSRMSAGNCGTAGSPTETPRGGDIICTGELCTDALPSSSNSLRVRSFSFSPRRSSSSRRRSPASPSATAAAEHVSSAFWPELLGIGDSTAGAAQSCKGAVGPVQHRSTKSLCLADGTTSKVGTRASSTAARRSPVFLCHACRCSRHLSSACRRCFIFLSRKKVPSSFKNPNALSSKFVCQCRSSKGLNCDSRMLRELGTSPESSPLLASGVPWASTISQSAR